MPRPRDLRYLESRWPWAVTPEHSKGVTRVLIYLLWNNQIAVFVTVNSKLNRDISSTPSPFYSQAQTQAMLFSPFGCTHPPPLSHPIRSCRTYLPSTLLKWHHLTWNSHDIVMKSLFRKDIPHPLNQYPTRARHFKYMYVTPGQLSVPQLTRLCQQLFVHD